MNPIVSGIVTILQLFFSKNPTVEDIITVIEQVVPAITAAKVGQAFTITFPIALEGHPGTTTFAWSPTPPPAA